MKGESNGQAAVPPTPKFRLGRTVITSNALTKLSQADVNRALRRHHLADWGDLDAHWLTSSEIAALGRTWNPAWGVCRSTTPAATPG